MSIKEGKSDKGPWVSLPPLRAVLFAADKSGPLSLPPFAAARERGSCNLPLLHPRGPVSFSW